VQIGSVPVPSLFDSSDKFSLLPKKQFLAARADGKAGLTGLLSISCGDVDDFFLLGDEFYLINLGTASYKGLICFIFSDYFLLFNRGIL